MASSLTEPEQQEILNGSNVPSSWAIRTVDEMKSPEPFSLATGPFGSAISSKYFTDRGIPVIRGSNLSQDTSVRLNDEGIVFVDEEKAREFRRSIARRGDLVFTCWGTIDQVGLIDKRSRFPEYVVSNKQMKFTPDPSKADGLFLYYLFSSPLVRAQILDHGIGSSVPGFNLGQLRSMAFAIPPLQEQLSIAHVLGTIDDKIELIRDSSETLEAIARAIFKSWFVDFDPVRAKAEGREPEGMDASTATLFPTSFDVSAIGEGPRGWDVVKIGDLATLDKGLSYKGDYLTDSGMPMINLGCFLGEGAFDPRKLKFYSGEFKPRHVARSGELVIANTDITQKRNVIGSPAIVPPSDTGEFLFTHHTFVLRPNTVLKGLTRYLYFSLLQPSFRERAIGFATGTTVLALPRDAISAQDILLPDPQILSKFAVLGESFAAKVYGNQAQSAILSSLRDTLLPRLISGKLRVPEAEKLVEAVL